MTSTLGEQTSDSSDVGATNAAHHEDAEIANAPKNASSTCLRELQRCHAELEQQRAAHAREVATIRAELDQANQRLKQMQAQIVAQEKMATLGTITAGIAHEIKNPLNFVVNFAALSIDLIAEIRSDLESWDGSAVTNEWRDNLDGSLTILADNCAKVNQHGLRADAIVRAMQMHARGQTSQAEPTDINRLVDETLALAYHGARSSDREFNATIEKNFDADLPLIHVIPGEMGRVFLNLISNGFHAVRAAASCGRSPTLRVSTHDAGEMIEIRIADNGSGIPEDVRARIFEPFFTTKPVSEGTGLGLSITRDIIEQMHGGSIRFETTTGEGTEFIVELPKNKAPSGNREPISEMRPNKIG